MANFSVPSIVSISKTNNMSFSLRNIRFKYNLFVLILHTAVEPVYNDIGLYDTTFITSDIFRYQSIPRC